PDGSLIRGSGQKVYLIELGKKRWIPSPQIFTGNNFGWKYIIRVDDDDLDDYQDGSNLTLSGPNRYPGTIILKGPEQGGRVENNKVSFEYSGTNPLGLTNELTFETFMVGRDSDWRSASRDEIEYTLSEQSGAYAFYVRAKNKEGYVDPTPASISFTTGLSSYYGKIEISQVRPDEDDFEKDYLVLENNDNDEQAISISGWKIQTKKGTITIPQAVEKLKYPFTSSNNSDINLAYGKEIIISLGQSPNGVNFQVNKCSGYFSQSSEFCPSLNNNCPIVEASEYSHLKKTCRDFIDDIDRCEMPSYLSNLDISIDSQCTSFLNENFNYSGCYNDNYQTVDFFEGEWRAFIKASSDLLDNDSDTISLKDKNGTIVDQYSY
ncbi:MAG: hypothetical protein ABH889_00550, partial [Candidatus Portnoybacteria bacterium]